MSLRTQTKHNIWSSLDEMGLLLSLPRLPDEDNYAYLDRLKQRMIHKPSSSKQGLVNALSIEFGLEPYVTDSKTIFFLTHTPVDVDTDGSDE